MRDEFSQSIAALLAKRVGVRCSNPGCRRPTSGPRLEPSKIINVGVAAHITAAAQGGARYDASLTPEDRASAANGIWLCQNCHKLIDDDAQRYTAELLRVWKEKSEEYALAALSGSSQLEQDIVAVTEVTVKYKCINESADLHEYQLELTVTNLGYVTINKYHVDLHFPTSVIAKPECHPLFVQGGKSEALSIFRFAATSTEHVIYPSDSRIVITLNYFMNHSLYWERNKLFSQLVTAKLYLSDRSPLVVETRFEKLQRF